MTSLVVATRSADKLREIVQILGPLRSVRIHDLHEAGVPESAEEDGLEKFDTFEENAFAKARYFAAKTGRLVLADDSGLCVDALGGAPGVRSKRFSGRLDLRGKALDAANNELLLERLSGVAAQRRGASYVCTVALVDPVTGWEEVTRGTCDGEILAEPRGAGGFGYDPLFYLPDERATFGEIDPARKNEISHRASAVRAACEILRRRLADG